MQRWPGLGSGPERETAASPAATTAVMTAGRVRGKTQIRDSGSHQGEAGRAAKRWSTLDLLESIRLRKGIQSGKALNLDLFREDGSHSKGKPLRKRLDLQRGLREDAVPAKARHCGYPEARLLPLCSYYSREHTHRGSIMRELSLLIKVYVCLVALSVFVLPSTLQPDECHGQTGKCKGLVYHWPFLWLFITSAGPTLRKEKDGRWHRLGQNLVTSTTVGCETMDC